MSRCWMRAGGAILAALLLPGLMHAAEVTLRLIEARSEAWRAAQSCNR